MLLLNILRATYFVVCFCASAAYANAEFLPRLVAEHRLATFFLMLLVSQVFTVGDILIRKKRIDSISAVYFGLLVGSILAFLFMIAFRPVLTHGSLTVPAPVKYFFTMCGMLSTEGSPLFWVASHRKHHVLSDQEGDPHTPNDGFWWSHILWFKPKKTREEEEELLARWAPDLWKDPVQRLFNNIFPVFSISLAIALFLIGEWTMESGWSLMLWGFCMRTVLCYHSTWFVNSATHVWGYRNYETTDRSRNLWWVALASYGEGWHNNHHAHQRLAAHGHRWWEFDVTYMVIRVLKFLRLATNVHDTIPEQETKTA